MSVTCLKSFPHVKFASLLADSLIQDKANSLRVNSGLNETDIPRMAAFDFKKLKIKAKHIVEFPQGLIGFASAKQFVLIDEPSSERFMWLASVDHQPNLRFLVADPVHITPDYRVKVEAGDLDFLHLSCIEDAEIFVIVTVPKNAIEATANLQSPILINTKRRMGKQIILEQGRYPIQYAILKECTSVNAGSER